MLRNDDVAVLNPAIGHSLEPGLLFKQSLDARFDIVLRQLEYRFFDAEPLVLSELDFWFQRNDGAILIRLLILEICRLDFRFTVGLDLIFLERSGVALSDQLFQCMLAQAAHVDVLFYEDTGSLARPESGNVDVPAELAK